MPPLSVDPIEDSFHRGRMSAAQAAAARLAARGTNAAKVKAGAAADAARDAQFQREMSAGGTQIDPATADRARRNHATLDQVGNADRSAIPAAVAGASDAVFGSVAPAIDAGGARYTNRGKGGLQYLSTLFGGAPPENPAPFSEAASQIGDTIQQRGNETLGVDTSDPNVDLGQAITRLIAGTLTPVPIGHEMAREGGPDITPSVLDRQPLDGSVLPPNTALQDHRTAQMARRIAAEQGWDISSIGRQRAGDDLRLQNVDARLGKEPDITPYELGNDSGVPEPPAPTQSMATITRPADEPIPPSTLPQRGMRGRSGPVEQAETRGSSNGTPVPDDGLWYYDNVGEALKDWQSKGTPEQLMAHLKKYKGAAEEADEIGLQQWLEDKKSVTKPEVQDYLDKNKVQVNEVWKGNGAPAGKEWRIELDPAATDAEGAEMFNVIDPDGNIQHTADFYDAQDYVRDRGGETARRNAAGRPTKYDDYQLPGGENYRELLLTKAEAQSKSPIDQMSREQLDREYEQAVGYRPTVDDPNISTEELRDLLRSLATDAGHNGLQSYKDGLLGADNFYSSHWDEPNILAHVRMNDRMLDGKKNLHIEEAQSDLHQTARKKGYKDPQKIADAAAARDTANKALDEFHQQMIDKYELPNDTSYKMLYHEIHGRLNASNTATTSGLELWKESQKYHQLEEAADEANAAHGRALGGVADAPFKGSGWKKLAMKRILKYAADNNYDGVTWTTGAQQAERYKLSKHVHTIGSLPLPEGDVPVGWPSSARGRLIQIVPHQGDRLVLHVDDSGKVFRGSANADAYVGKDLSNIVGKDLTEKLMTRGPTFTVSGEGLDIGGEGMEGFYDRELPNITNDLLKKHSVKVNLAHTGQWEVFDPANGHPLKRFHTEAEAAAYADANPNLDYDRVGTPNIAGVVPDPTLHDLHHVAIPPSLKSSKLPLFAVAGAAAVLGAAKSSQSSSDDPIAESFHRGRARIKR